MEKRLILGSGNRAKLEMVRDILAPLEVEVVGAGEIGLHLQVEEDGTTPQANARRKALAYVRPAGEPVLAIDNALYLEGLPPEEQPGMHVRRIPGSKGRPSDAAMLRYYRDLIRRLGGEVRGVWLFAVALAHPDGRLDETIIETPRRFVARPSPILLPGYPLESLQIDPQTGRYISEMSEEERAAFWQRTLGQALRAFIQRALALPSRG